MKEQYIINANIVDPGNNFQDLGGIIINDKGEVKAIGKKVTRLNIPKNAEVYDAKKN